MKKRIPIIFLCVCMALMLLPATALAASGSQDGLQVSLTTDKSGYAAGETVSIDVAVTNTNAFHVPDGKLELALPDGLTLQSGTGTAAVDLAAGRTTTLSFYAVRNDALDEIPGTGDAPFAGLWLGLMLVPAGALACLLLFLIFKKKMPAKFLSVFLCLALLTLLMAPTATLAATVARSLTVTQSIAVDGEGYALKAKLDYGWTVSEASAPAVYAVTVNNGTGDGTYTAGTTVTIAADAPAAGMAFAGWTVVSGGVTLAEPTDATTTFTMPANAVEVTATYAQTYAVTVNNGTGGGNYAAGAVVTIAADAPAAGMAFAGWTVVSGGVTLADPASATTTFTMPAGEIEVTATYRELFLSFSSNGNVTMATILPTGSVYMYGIVGENGSADQWMVPFSPSLDLTGEDASLALARTVTADTVLKEISVTFTNQTPLALIGTEITVYADLYVAPPGSDVYSALAVAGVTLSPPLTGMPVIGDELTGGASGLNVPISAGSKLILVCHTQASGMMPASTVTGTITATATIE